MNSLMLSDDEMFEALLERNSEYDGLFFVGVRTTGIFCRCTCTARKPLRQNVRFFGAARDALLAGFRPCRRCHPLEASGRMPPWLEEIVVTAENDLPRRWTDEDIRRQGTDPARVRRWFQRHHGITFHGFLRARRLSFALAQLSIGEDPARAAFDAGYESLSGFREAFGKWFGTPPGAEANRCCRLTVNRILSPLGPMIAAADDASLYLLEFADRRMLTTQFSRLARHLDCAFIPGENEILTQTDREVTEYFGGRRRQFDVPITSVGTEFQRSVWQKLTEIPYGETVPYEQIARAVQNPGAVRAVGRANGDNRLAIIIPCHRVVRSDGTLSGYGGGLRRKEWLLAHERCQVQQE